MRALAAIALIAATLGASAATKTVTLSPSSMSFKQAMAACPGALAAITMVQHHVRIAEQAGVSSDVDDSSPTAQAISLSSSGGSAMVAANAQAYTVSAKNVTLSGKSVACIAAD